MEEPLEVGATFPAPPIYYKGYTSRNLDLLEKLKTDGPEAIAEEKDLPDFDLHELEPPRVDWIVEEGGYQSFGDVFYIPNREPSLAEVGLVQLYDTEARDRRPALHSLLRTLLHSYHSLLSSLLSGPNMDIASLEETPVFQYTEWMMAAALNMMHAVNGLRVMQARIMLEGIMRAQVEERRRKVAEVRQKCKSLRGELAYLRERSSRLTSAHQERVTVYQPDQAALPQARPVVATLEDIARWVDEV